MEPVDLGTALIAVSSEDYSKVLFWKSLLRTRAAKSVVIEPYKEGFSELFYVSCPSPPKRWPFRLSLPQNTSKCVP